MSRLTPGRSPGVDRPTFLRLTRAERGLLFAAVIRVAVVRVALWVLPSPLIIRYVKKLARKTSAVRHPPSGKLPDILWAIDAASRRIPDASCLTQAIAGIQLLRRHGYSARFCVGVAHGPSGTINAHAWLERDGRVLIGRSDQVYVPLHLART